LGAHVSRHPLFRARWRRHTGDGGHRFGALGHQREGAQAAGASASGRCLS
jgi:hypothetical protein